MTAAFVQSTLQELMRSMDDARTPWSYDVSAAWVDGEDAYVVFTTTATGSRLLGDVLNIRASLDCYGSSSAADLAHLVFALEIQSHRYYELPSVTTGLGIVNPIYWFATTAATAMVGTVDDIDRDYRRRDVQQGNSLAMTRRGSSGKALLAQQLPNAGMMP